MERCTGAGARDRGWLALSALFLLLGLANSEIIGWEECYVEEANEHVITTRAISSIYPHPSNADVAAVQLEMNVGVDRAITSGRWDLELWHEETGKRIHYRGPYDLCCGLVTDSDSPPAAPVSAAHISSPLAAKSPCASGHSDCPLLGEVSLAVSRPLHERFGVYEATFRVFGQLEEEQGEHQQAAEHAEEGPAGEGAADEEEFGGEELMCIVVKFLHRPQGWEEEVLGFQPQEQGEVDQGERKPCDGGVCENAGDASGRYGEEGERLVARTAANEKASAAEPVLLLSG